MPNAPSAPPEARDTISTTTTERTKYMDSDHTITITDRQRDLVISALEYLADNESENDLVDIWQTSLDELAETRNHFITP